jgi:hypothetical protein
MNRRINPKIIHRWQWCIRQNQQKENMYKEHIQ